MVEKIDIEKYCNRYEELYRLVCFLEQQYLSNEERTLLKSKLDKIVTDISKLHSKQSDCVVLTYIIWLFCLLICRDEDKTKFNISQEEITSIQTKAEIMKINVNEMLYFLVCAKIPYYSSRVVKSLKHSFVDASFSLYYSNWFYVFSSLSKLFEVSTSIVVNVSSILNQLQQIMHGMIFSRL